MVLACGLLASGTAGAGVTYPKRELASESAGYLESQIGRYLYRGSAVVARDPKLLFSCAHLFYEKGRWASSYRFARAWDADTYPEASQMVAPRGFKYFTSYATESDNRGSESNAAFASCTPQASRTLGSTSTWVVGHEAGPVAVSRGACSAW